MADTEFAKVHLREHLSGLIVPPISEGFWSIYTSSKEICERNGQLDQILRTFQNMLTRIPEWSDSTLSTEVDRIIKVSNCNYLDDLIMGVFIAYMKSFASLHYRGNSSHIKIDFERPSVAKFIHELYKHSARKLWQVAYLFRTDIPAEVQARNRQEIEKIINQCMEQVVRAFLPWEAIAKNYFVEAPQDIPVVSQSQPETKTVQFEQESDSDSDSDDEEETPPKLNLTEEAGTIDIEDLDKKEEPPKEDEKEEEVDPLKEIESKISNETLVLKL